MPKPLDDVVIIDLTHMLSGPFCTMMLADLGARTIKVEPHGGELTRRLLANDINHSRHGMGAYFMTLNRNKESVVINLKQPEGLAVFYELVKCADVVINNFSPGVPKRLGIEWETLSKHNPRIITCSITGFGETGPYPDRPAFDQVAQAMGGGMSITGFPDGQPLRAGIPIGDLGGGTFAVIGVLSALQARNATGRGQHIDISMLDVQISLLNYMATMHLLSGETPKPLGNGHFVHVPYDTFRTQDRWLVVAIITDTSWESLVAALDTEDLRDESFVTQPGRWASREFINRRVQEILLTKSSDYWLEHFGRYKIPCAPVNDFQHALNDPQVRHRNMVADVNLVQGGRVQMPGNPIKLSDTRADSFLPPPLLGQQTKAILSELLGKSEHDIARLRDIGAVG